MANLDNLYDRPPDFAQLACDVPAFLPHVRTTSTGSTIDWGDDQAVRALTCALLERDFDIELKLPNDRLCPTVPSRLEYVLWVLRLALATRSATDPPSTIVGIDVGTGASAIYPLLASRTLSRLDPPLPHALIATDIDRRSLEYARANVARNGLDGIIEVKEVDATGSIFPTSRDDDRNEGTVVDFTMCNPPFYSDQDEIERSAGFKELEPFAVCTGGSNEMITPGGEVEFVSRMVIESLEGDVGRTKIRWFSSLLGKHSSIAPLVALLKTRRITNYLVHALPPHGHTTRYVLTWSLQQSRIPSRLIEAPHPSLVKLVQPFQRVQVYDFTSSRSTRPSVTDDRDATTPAGRQVSPSRHRKRPRCDPNLEPTSSLTDSVSRALRSILLGALREGGILRGEDEVEDGDELDGLRQAFASQPSRDRVEREGRERVSFRWDGGPGLDDDDTRPNSREQQSRQWDGRRDKESQDEVFEARVAGSIKVWDNVWSRAARRSRNKRRRDDTLPEEDGSTPETAASKDRSRPVGNSDDGTRVARPSPLFEARITLSFMRSPSEGPSPKSQTSLQPRSELLSPPRAPAQSTGPLDLTEPTPISAGRSIAPPRSVRFTSEWTRGPTFDDPRSAEKEYASFVGVVRRKVGEIVDRGIGVW
ncbi:hypothetical protein JCM10212_000172 [Sporobolomyces blumeae]